MASSVRSSHSARLSVYPLASARYIARSPMSAMREPETAYRTLSSALAGEEVRLGAKYLSAGYYNLGLACRRTGREQEAVRRFNEAIDALPHSLYAYAAQQALKERSSGKE